jgi:hypothetical protein
MESYLHFLISLHCLEINKVSLGQIYLTLSCCYFESSPGGVKNFNFSKSSRPALSSTQPPIQWVPGALSPGVKRPGREVDHSPPASAEVKKMWIYTSTPHTPSWHNA